MVFLLIGLSLVFSKTIIGVKKIPKNVYMTTWRNKWITSGASSIGDFIKIFEALAEKFRQWKELGITLENDSGVGNDYATFITDNMDVEIKANFTFNMGDDRETQYLERLSGEEVKVPKEKLEQFRN